MLTRRQRKSRLPFGAVVDVAREQEEAVSTVSDVLKGRSVIYSIQDALAARMVPATTTEEAFGPPKPETRKRRARTGVA